MNILLYVAFYFGIRDFNLTTAFMFHSNSSFSKSLGVQKSRQAGFLLAKPVVACIPELVNDLVFDWFTAEL